MQLVFLIQKAKFIMLTDYHITVNKNLQNFNFSNHDAYRLFNAINIITTLEPINVCHITNHQKKLFIH